MTNIREKEIEIKVLTYRNSLFDQCLRIRQKAYAFDYGHKGNAAAGDNFDVNAIHFLASKAHEHIGTLRIIYGNHLFEVEKNNQNNKKNNIVLKYKKRFVCGM